MIEYHAFLKSMAIIDSISSINSINSIKDGDSIGGPSQQDPTDCGSLIAVAHRLVHIPITAYPDTTITSASEKEYDFEQD